jgi:hypothetical protein
MSDPLYAQTVLSYIQISEAIKMLDPLQQYGMIHYLETTYEDEADTLLGDFLDEMVQLFVYELYEEDLYSSIQTLIDASDINIRLAYNVGQSILMRVIHP